MSLKNEIVSKQFLAEITTPKKSLWRRFQRVREAIALSLSPKPPDDVQREFNTFNWSGADEGIHDHKASVSGTINGTCLELTIKGTTVDNNPQYVIDNMGKWQLTHNNEQYLEVAGSFTSKDGRKGALEIQLRNGKPHYEAYWLQSNEGLRLEQVISPNGAVFNADELKGNNNLVRIPDTELPDRQHEIPRILQK